MKKVYFFITTAVLSLQSFGQVSIAHFPLDSDFWSNVEGTVIELQATADAIYEYVPAQADNGVTINGSGLYSNELVQYLPTSDYWSISLWCNAGAQANSYATIIEIGESLFLRYTNNVMEFGYYNGTEWVSSGPQMSLTDNQWHLYTIRYEPNETSSSLNLNIDGQVSVSAGLQGSWQQLHNMCVFGTGTNDGLFNNLKGLTGTIDDIQIFPYYLTDGEITELINNTSATHVNTTHELAIGVYPNPTTEWVTIDIPSNLIGARVSVVNINGQVVLEELANAQKLNLNVSSLATGNYTVTVKNEDAILSSTLIKQ